MRIFESIEALAEAVGEEIGVSDWVVLDQVRVNAFADATSDHQWIHVDAERARRALPSKGTIAQGYLILSLIPWLAAGACQIEGVSRQLPVGVNEVRFPLAVRTGARIRLRQTLLSAVRRAGGTEFTFAMTVEIEGEERPACIAQTVSLAYPLATPPAVEHALG